MQAISLHRSREEQLLLEGQSLARDNVAAHATYQVSLQASDTTVVCASAGSSHEARSCAAGSDVSYLITARPLDDAGGQCLGIVSAAMAMKN